MASSPQNLQELLEISTPQGVNLAWVLPGDAWLASPAPPGGRLLLLASAGPGVWAGQQAHMQAEPNPLDHLTLRLLQGFNLPEQQIFYPKPVSGSQEKGLLPPPLQQLARLTGEVAPSPLGPDLHLEYGSWFGLRGLLWAKLDWPVTQAQPAWEGACASCATPCAPACPAQAVKPGQPLDWQACSLWRQQGGCPHACPARKACHKGRPYHREQEAFHAKASLSWLQSHPLPKLPGKV